MNLSAFFFSLRGPPSQSSLKTFLKTGSTLMDGENLSPPSYAAIQADLDGRICRFYNAS